MRADHEWYTDPRYAQKERTDIRRCDAGGCVGHGEYKAPRTRGGRDYYWFCLPHVQEYNKKWNYFANMSPAEVEHFQREAITGHRPTWKMGTQAGSGKQANEQLEQKWFEFMNPELRERAQNEIRTRALKPHFRTALSELGADWPIELEALKKLYKKLAKQLHPDMNPGHMEEAAERFKVITHAYHLLARAIDAGEI